MFAEMWIRIPTGIKENEQDADVVFVGDGEKRIDALLEASGILLPEKVVEKNAHGV